MLDKPEIKQVNDRPWFEKLRQRAQEHPERLAKAAAVMKRDMKDLYVSAFHAGQQLRSEQWFTILDRLCPPKGGDDALREQALRDITALMRYEIHHNRREERPRRMPEPAPARARLTAEITHKDTFFASLIDLADAFSVHFNTVSWLMGGQRSISQFAYKTHAPLEQHIRKAVGQLNQMYPERAVSLGVADKLVELAERERGLDSHQLRVRNSESFARIKGEQVR